MPLTTYDELGSAIQKSAGSIREDLLDFIENLSPHDTPLYNNLGQIKVNAGFVEYLEDTLDAASTNAFVEAAVATDQTLAVPVRNASIVQNFQAHWWVSNRQKAVTHAGLSNMETYQEIKKLKVLKTDIELALTRGSAVSGTNTVAPQLAGMLNVLVTNATASSGTTLTEKIFNDLLMLGYNYNVNIREVYSNMFIKRTINNFSQNTQRFVPAGDKRQVNVIDAYESELGVLTFFKSRYMTQGATPGVIGSAFMAIDPDYFQVGWLRPIVTKELGVDGDRTRKFAVGELTLIARSEKAGIVGTNYIPYIPA